MNDSRKSNSRLVDWITRRLSDVIVVYVDEYSIVHEEIVSVRLQLRTLRSALLLCVNQSINQSIDLHLPTKIYEYKSSTYSLMGGTVRLGNPLNYFQAIMNVACHN